MKLKNPKLFLKTLLILMTLSLTSCYFQKLVLKNTDTIAYFWLADLVSLDSRQKQLLDRIVKGTWLKLRCEGLKTINKNLQNFKVYYYTSALNKEFLKTVQNKIKQFRLTIINYHLDDLVELIHSLNQKQIVELVTNIKEKNKDWKELAEGSETDFIEEYTDKINERFEFWYGDINKGQEKKLYSSVGTTHKNIKENLAEWDDINQNILNFLSSKPSKELIKKQILSWLDKPIQLRSKAFQEQYQSKRKLWYSKILKTDQLTTAKQKKHLIEKAETWIQDLKSFTLPANQCTLLLEQIPKKI